MKTIELDIKPISNNALQGVTRTGKVYKKKEAREFERQVYFLLKVAAVGVKIPEQRDLELVLRFYVSRKFDTSNCVKLIEDCIADFFKINDRRFAGHKTSRVVVKEGEEKIRFKIEPYQDLEYII